MEAVDNNTGTPNITLASNQDVTCEKDLQVDGNLTVTGTIPADKLTGALPAISGASLTNLPASGASLSGSTDNTVVTVTGSNAMQGEANLTFDGSTLTHKATNDLHHMMESGTAGYCRIAMGDSDDDNIGQILYNNANNKWDITGNAAVRVEIESDGDVKLNTGNLVIGTSGKGIDFSATSDGGASQDTEVLDDYEEGVWTPTAENGCTGVGYYTPHYVKIGNLCTVVAYIHQIAGADGNTFRIGGLPYSVKSNKTGALGTVILHASNFPDNHMLTAVNSSAGNSYFQLFTSRDDYNWYTWVGNDVENGGTLVITLTYRTN